MTDWQLFYMAVLTVAILAAVITTRWQREDIIAVMAANFWVSAFGPQEWLAVEQFDLACAAILLFGGARAKVISALFVAIAAVGYVAGLLGWPTSTTYAIMDVLAVMQCGVLAGVDRGGLRLVGRARLVFGALHLRLRNGPVLLGRVAARDDAQTDR